MFIYQTVGERLKLLDSKPSNELENFSHEIKLRHGDRTEIHYSCCYWEFMKFPDPNNPARLVTCILVIPEHHPAVFYDLEDLEFLESIEESYVDQDPVSFSTKVHKIYDLGSEN